MKPVLAIGDVHGHLDRLEALLKQEGIIGECPMCKGTGDLHARAGGPTMVQTVMCGRCDGDGIARINDDVTVVQLGDLGHFGQTGSPTADTLCYKYANDGWIDIILWGNHDRYVVDESHAFRGGLKPGPETMHSINSLFKQNRYKLAYSAYGFLMTHAGLHLVFRDQKVDDKLKRDPTAFADWINEAVDPGALITPDQAAVRDAVGMRRGGASKYGGILWRDIQEKLYMPFRQVFGHSADHRRGLVRYCWEKEFTSKPVAAAENTARFGPPSYCIDVGSPDNGRLAGIWLPDERIVSVTV